MNVDGLTRWIAPLKNRVANMVARAVVSAIDDSKKIQLVQLDLLEGETRNEVERFQNYGFTSKPRSGAEAVVLFVGGRRDHGLAIVVDDRRYRFINLSDGEVAVYNDTGARIVFKANGDIELVPKPGQKVKVSSDVEVTGTLTASTDVVGGGKSLKTHTHSPNSFVVAGTSATGGPVTGTATGTTGAPT